MTMTHLTEDDLVLHYYGELDGSGDERVTTQLSGCGEGRRSYRGVQRAHVARPCAGYADGDRR